MGPFKSLEGKATKHAGQARRAASEKFQHLRLRFEALQARRAEQRFARSPVGQAIAAYERGDALFQTSIPVDASSAQILSEIEALGWHLDHADYTSVASTYTTTDADGDVDSVYVDERLVGVYLFRRP